jgi:hypothetical protein
MHIYMFRLSINYIYNVTLGHYATSWKVAGSIPDVIEFFN